MKIGLGSDHRGYAVKQRLATVVHSAGHDVTDYGAANAETSVDYPDYAFKVAEAISKGEIDLGILICGTGVGMCIAANKVQGVRAALGHDPITAEMSRRHNDANILCLSADLLGEELIERMVRVWIDTEFEGGRHGRRLEKITQYEKQSS